MNKRKSSITAQLCLGVILPIVLVLVLAGLFIISQVRSAIFHVTDQNLTSESASAASQANQFFTQYLSGAQCAAAEMEMENFIKAIPAGGPRMNTVEGYPSLKLSLDRVAATDTETVQAAWIGDFDSSQITQSDGYNSPVGWDITSRPWYRVADTKAPVLTEPYIDASTGEMIVTAAAPVFDSVTGEPIGAFGFDFKLDQLNQKIDAITIGEKGFVIFCSKDNQIVHFPDAAYLQKDIAESPLSSNVVDAVRNLRTGLLTHTLNGEPYHGYLSQVGDTGWTILTALPDSEYQQASSQISFVILASFLFGILLLTAIVLLLASGIVKPLRKLAAATGKIAAGDLDVEIECSSGNEVGQVAFAMSQTVTRLRDYINYIDELSAVLDQIANGNLIFNLKYDYAGEFAKLKNALLRIQATLSATLREITDSADEVSNGSEHISAGAQALAQGTTEQASAVEELSATIEDISDKVRASAEDANRANGRVQEVGGSIRESNRQMQQLISAMTEINEGSRQIGSIIKVIEDIAFQTNILALNAAVEAARAGAAGKGFAVVADEVRSLANKSQEAAKDTTALLQSSIESVKNGTTLANQTAASLQAVVEGIEHTVGLVEHISEAANAQSTAISQVSQGVGQISSVVQTNSATAEESAAASVELSNQARKLMRSVQKFKI